MANGTFWTGQDLHQSVRNYTQGITGSRALDYAGLAQRLAPKPLGNGRFTQTEPFKELRKYAKLKFRLKCPPLPGQHPDPKSKQPLSIWRLFSTNMYFQRPNKRFSPSRTSLGNRHAAQLDAIPRPRSLRLLTETLAQSETFQFLNTLNRDMGLFVITLFCLWSRLHAMASFQWRPVNFLVTKSINTSWTLTR